MKILFLFFSLFGAVAYAQTSAAKTEAGFSFCATCAKTTSGFVLLASDEMKQLDKAMKSDEKKLVFFDKKAAEAETEQKLVFRFPEQREDQAIFTLGAKTKAPALEQSLDEAQTSRIGIGVHRLPRSRDTHQQMQFPRLRNTRSIGVKYTKKFY